MCFKCSKAVVDFQFTCVNKCPAFCAYCFMTYVLEIIHNGSLFKPVNCLRCPVCMSIAFQFPVILVDDVGLLPIEELGLIPIDYACFRLERFGLKSMVTFDQKEFERLLQRFVIISVMEKIQEFFIEAGEVPGWKFDKNKSIQLQTHYSVMNAIQFCGGINRLIQDYELIITQEAHEHTIPMTTEQFDACIFRMKFSKKYKEELKAWVWNLKKEWMHEKILHIV